MHANADWPTEAEERALITALETGTPTARNELAERFLKPLVRFLRGAVYGAAPDLCDTAAEEAIFALLQNPGLFEPRRGRLGAYLRMAARGDLLNALHRERHARRGIPLGSVAEPVARGNGTCEDEPSWDDPRMVAEVGAFDGNERAALELMRDGTRETAAFAKRFGWGHLPATEQAAAVKRVKDRVKKRLVRAVGGRS